MRRLILLPLLGMVCLLAAGLTAAQAPKPAEKKFTAADLDFFEKKIRPALTEHCLKCHGQDPQKLRGGLDLTTREAILKGGDSGPAAIPGKPEESLLIQALRYQDAKPEMPPTGMLPRPLVQDFEQWVKRGLPDPRVRGAAVAAYPDKIDMEKARQFWAFQPPKRLPAPAVKDTQWSLNDIDRFLLAGLEAKGLKPAPDADAVTLLRRLHFDLIGLPPSPVETDEFVKAHSASPQAAIEQVVDKLLASPRFGERWGRHWLDIARYADSNGLDENLTFHEAWRYRDYVIAAFNKDKPYDRFLREQLAGDLLPASDEQQKHEQMTATGFLVMGPKILAERDKAKLTMDLVDEQLDTTGRAFLGLTLGCARCHDHKFDPIPTADYYALAGIFKSTQTLMGSKLGNPVVSGWMLRPLAPEAQYKAYQEHLAGAKKITGELTAANTELKKLEAMVKKEPAAVVAKLTGQGKLGVVVDDKQAVLKGEWKHSTFHPLFVGEGYIHDNKEAKGQKSATFAPELPEAGEYEVRVAYSPGAGRPEKVPFSVKGAVGEQKVFLDQRPTPPIDKLWAKLGRYRFAAGKAGSVTVSTEGTDGAFVVIDAVQFIPVALLDKKPGTEDQAATKAPKPKKPAPAADKALEEKLATLRQRIKGLEAKKAELDRGAPPPVPLAMAVADTKPADCAICVRGNHLSLGPVVPRGFLTVIPPKQPPKIASSESGRRELAEWLAGPENPLTGRVMVNRIWHHLIGAGLVRTTDDFGQRGERPSHPELLDWLAVTFRENGWSMKGMIRQICLSHAYRMSSAPSADGFKADPDNRLLWHSNRRRLEVEAIRDAMLTAGGTLDLKAGGDTLPHHEERAIDNQSKGTAQLESNRRSVYLTVFRNDVPEMFQVFDFVDPHVLDGARDTTTVATQALFLMNSKFALDRSQDLARRLLDRKDLDGAGRVTLAYRLTLSRLPRDAERERALKYINAHAEELKSAEKDTAKRDLRAWQAFCQVLFASTEFRYID